MATRLNPLAGRYFNDPQIASALSNLASVFAPPSATDHLAWTKAASEKAEAQRLSDLWAAAGDDFDKMGVAAGQWNPNQSYYAVDTADATTRRGQDIDSADARRGQDIVADTAVKQALIGLGDTTLSHGDVMPGVPADLAEALGVPAFPAQSGADLGAPQPPMTESEVKGAERTRLRETGQLTDDMLLSTILGDVPVETVTTPEGPRIVQRHEAVGQEPYFNPGAQAKPDLETYRTPNGRTGTAIYDTAVGKWMDTQSGEVLPEGTVTGKIQDTAQGIGATTANVTKGNEVLAEVDYGLQRVSEFKQLLEANPGVLGVTGMLRGFAQDLVAAADEAGAAYGVIDSVEELHALASRVGASGRYDPAIAQAGAFALEMAYLQAKMQDPSGEVNVRELERLLTIFDGGLAGNPKVLANLDVLEGQLQQRKMFAQQLNGSSGGAGVPSPQGPVRITDDAGYDALPSGTVFIDPDGNERRKP